LELYEKTQHEKLSEKEKNRLKSLTGRLQELGPIQLELLSNIRAFKDYFYNHLWELMNRFFVNRVRGKFFKHISQKYKKLRKEQKSEQEEEIMQKNVLLKQTIKEVESIEEVENILIEEKLELKIELEEYKDYQQELEDALEEYRKIEVRASVEFEELKEELTESENENEENSKETSEEEYELIKQMYRQQTGRRPIYAGKETKSFIKWLESLTIKLEEKNEKEMETQNEDEFKAIIEKYKYTGSWKIVSEDYAHYSRDTLYRMVRITLGEEEYNKLVKNYSNQKNTFNQTKKVIIPNDILNEIIRIFKSNEFKGWREMSNRYSEYSEKVIWSRVKENLGDDTYHSVIESKSTKITIPEEILNEMIEKFKTIGSWNKISELYSEYKMDTIVSRVKYFIGQTEYESLKQNYSGNKDISLEKIIVPEDTLRDMIEKFKQLHSWVKVSNQYPDYPTNIIRNRVKEYLGGNSYRNLVKNHRKGLPTRSREIFIPIETLRSKIEDYKQKGIWEKVMADKDQYSLSSLIRQIKEMIGIENYQSLIDQYSIKDNSNLVPNKKIVIPLPILNLMIIEYKKLHSWTKVSDIFPDYSTGITSERVKECLGPEEYEKLIQQYSKKIIPSRKISISESFLKEIIKEYDKHQSWTKIAESYTFSRSFISLRVKEYLGEEGYNELIKREVNETQYTKLFYNEEYRVQNAFAQIVQIVDNRIVKPQLDKSFENWEDVFYFLKENPLFKFTDILTGEIIEENCLIDLHHIDGDKSNDALINLVYLLHENHTIISIAQNNWKLLRVFFEELITSNLKSLSKGIIPRSWILGWRSLAIEHGINLPEKSYQRHGLIFRNITGKESKVLQLINFKGRSTNGKIAVIDVEHTGGNPNQGKIVEIGIVDLDINSGEITPIFNSLIREKGFSLKEFSKNYFMNNVNKISPKLVISLGEKFTLEYNKQIIQNILQSYKKVFYWDCTNHTERQWLKIKGFDVSNFHDFQFFVKSYLKTKNIRKFNFQYVWNYFLNEHYINASKYLREPEYYQNHRAYDDAEHEALLLYYLVKEKQFKLK
jgi:hypothetical protein